ncbi:hypothetical protein LOK49_LG15G02260 [Camellia lanceoleosa]|uniref:Uncharacterized protein n=1 Tax=Camellia lanceoleosa TaxID=1840588 RepID=A0ACC0F6E9_9ERIC|nr:hypothetical protein LOK49_LG15G02260 [Camellia lanceoleosa]
MVETIVITDSGKKRAVELRLDGDSLVKFKEYSLNFKTSALSLQKYGLTFIKRMKVRHVPLLRLQVSGYSMDGACLCLLKLPNVHDDDNNGDEEEEDEEEEQEAETEEEEEEEEQENNHQLDFKAILAAFEEELKEDNNKHNDYEAILAAFEEEEEGALREALMEILAVSAWKWI